MKTLYPYFSQNPLDRMDQLRRDEEQLSLRLQQTKSHYLLFCGNDIIVKTATKEAFLEKKDLEAFDTVDTQMILLGEFENRLYFAMTYSKVPKEGYTKISLREFVSLNILDESFYGILSQGASVLHWHHSHIFCSTCGAKTVMKQHGSRRDCTVCKKEHFPRIDPVVIVLVTFGEYCLLGRGHHFKQGSYSCLAGYVELGETFETAAKREIFEESGVQGYDVQYVMSQPWPFPTTLMVGMRMKAKSQTLKLDTHEIEDAMWVHKDEVKQVLKGQEGLSFNIPSKVAIARNLLELWVQEID